MGLCKQERLTGLFESIKYLNDIGLKLEKKKSDSLLCRYLLDLWPSMLGGEGNSLLWIMGSSVGGSEFIDPNDLFSSAMYNNFHEHEKNYVEPDEYDARLEARRQDESDDRIKLIDYVSEFRPSFSSVLNGTNTFAWDYGDEVSSEDYVKVFMGVESAFYRLNRYDDEFSERFGPLKKLLAKIFGLCYSVFASNEDFFVAFLMNHISEKVLTYSYDVVNIVFCKHNMHHNWRIPNRNDENPTVKDLFDIFKSVQGRKKLSLEERLIINIRVCGNRFHYKHEHESMIRSLKEHNDKKGAELISIKNVQEALNAYCQEINKESTGLNRHCLITEQSEDEITEREAEKKIIKKIKSIKKKRTIKVKR